jgi:hypothetical protein
VETYILTNQPTPLILNCNYHYSCAASPLGAPTGEGARALLAVHGALLRYGAALDAAHDELQRTPAPGLADAVGAAVAAVVGGSGEW